MNTPTSPPSVATSAVFAVLSPVLDWYQCDEQPARDALDIVRDIVSDLQTDRKTALIASSAADDALKLCHQIEQCGCSVELTKASTMASELRAKLASANAELCRPEGGEKGDR